MATSKILVYPVTLTPDSNGTYLVGFPDFPNCHSVGDDVLDALLNAADALATVTEGMLKFPKPSRIENPQYVVACEYIQPSRRKLEHPYQNADGSFRGRKKNKRKLRRPTTLTIVFTEPVTPHTQRMDEFMKQWMNFVAMPPVWEGANTLDVVVQEDGTVVLKDQPDVKVTGDGANELIRRADGKRTEFSVHINHMEPIGLSEATDQPVEVKVNFSYGTESNRIGGAVDSETPNETEEG